MTPKEKAEELVDRFREYSHTDFNYSRGGYQVDTQIQNAKQCALIAVDEILSFIEDDRKGFNWKDYYKEVKQELEKL
jgi:hypothetical protein